VVLDFLPGDLSPWRQEALLKLKNLRAFVNSLNAERALAEERATAAAHIAEEEERRRRAQQEAEQEHILSARQCAPTTPATSDALTTARSGKSRSPGSGRGGTNKGAPPSGTVPPSGSQPSGHAAQNAAQDP